jgi:hypothetical protein
MTPDNQRALQTSNLAIIRAAAAELPRIGVAEAGAMLLVIARVAPDNYDRAALRWLVKLCQERSAVELDDIVALPPPWPCFGSSRKPRGPCWRRSAAAPADGRSARGRLARESRSA